ncbi:uncharacterized protein LOC143017520 [Oratosquilla oratoria]|uniref:uncharacterized protein LOC143017520 n=1 Tax=Oratosquilla oratoria TaxID=337810 RepID=UPI003F76D62E
MATFVVCRPDEIIDVELEDQHHDAEGDAGDEVSGSYSWTSPEGVEYFVKYVADEDGYRVVESNAVPVSGGGVRANGEQGSFDSYEAEDDNIDDK